MSDTRIISSIDIGSTKVTTLISQVGWDKQTSEQTINVIGVSSVDSKGVRKGQIVDIDDAVETVLSSVESAERMAGFNVANAFISVGGAHIQSQNSHGVVAVSGNDNEITFEDVDRVIEAAKAVSIPSSREILHVIPREFSVDGENGVKDAVGMSGVRLEVETHLVSASAPAIKNLAKTIEKIGVDIDGLVYSGLASSYSTVSDTEKELGCVLVDVGGGTTSIAAFLDGSLAFSSVIPVGARNVTNDLAIGMRVSLEDAEKIKIALGDKPKVRRGEDKKDDRDDYVDISELGVEEGKKVSKKTLVEGIVRPRLNEIFTMVRMELTKAGIAAQIPSGAVITGGGALTVGVAESARRMLALPVRVAAPAGVNGLVDGILTPAYATSIGLLMYGIETDIPEKKRLTIWPKRFKFDLPANKLVSRVVHSIRDLLP